jgi:hypothetical protein
MTWPMIPYDPQKWKVRNIRAPFFQVHRWQFDSSYPPICFVWNMVDSPEMTMFMVCSWKMMFMFHEILGVFPSLPFFEALIWRWPDGQAPWDHPNERLSPPCSPGPWQHIEEILKSQSRRETTPSTPWFSRTWIFRCGPPIPSLSGLLSLHLATERAAKCLALRLSDIRKPRSSQSNKSPRIFIPSRTPFWQRDICISQLPWFRLFWKKGINQATKKM